MLSNFTKFSKTFASTPLPPRRHLALHRGIDTVGSLPASVGRPTHSTPPDEAQWSRAVGVMSKNVQFSQINSGMKGLTYTLNLIITAIVQFLLYEAVGIPLASPSSAPPLWRQELPPRNVFEILHLFM